MRERVRRTKGMTVTDQVLEERGSGTEGSQTSTLLSVLSSCPYYPLPSGPILAETLRSSVTRPISLFLMLPFPKLLRDHYRHPAATTPPLPSPRRSIYSAFNFLLDAFVPHFFPPNPPHPPSLSPVQSPRPPPPPRSALFSHQHAAVSPSLV